MAMVFTDATKPDDPIIFANDSFPRSASMSSIIIRTSITSLGYGDVVINGRARLIAPLQAVNGLMMFGITTGLFIAAFQHAVKKWIETHRDSARH
ncbi:hypothetical protein KIP88_25195 [Bradyrhizobium sp. SRL28]|nr:hypothetical protein [Bradyrhizobium sp. SRL28]